MIDPKYFIDVLKGEGVSFFSGVPDSLLKEFCSCLNGFGDSVEHLSSTNEASAIALALGHFLAKGKPGLVYMQNSGLGNCVNPLTSLTDKDVFSIPMVLLIGWRGEILANGEQIKDEPQHVKQGRITLGLLDVLDIPYEVIGSDSLNYEEAIKKQIVLASERMSPTAIVVRKGTFAKYSSNIAAEVEADTSGLKREEIIESIASIVPNYIPFVATTGMASRELFELRRNSNSGNHRDFLCVGGMGLASQIAAGISCHLPEKHIVCIDGDGAILMHAGALSVCSDCKCFIHVLINNKAHDSVGGQPTKADRVSFTDIALGFGYKNVYSVDSIADLQEVIGGMIKSGHGGFIEVACQKGSRPDLGRPDRTPIENRDSFMEHLKELFSE